MYANAIAINATTSIEENKRQHFSDRLYEIRMEKHEELQLKYGQKDLPAAKTPEELIQRIKDGKYLIKSPDREAACDGYDEDRYYSDPWHYIRFRDLANKRDNEGFERAYEALTRAFDDAKDLLWNAADPIKTIADFRTWKYTTA